MLVSCCCCCTTPVFWDAPFANRHASQSWSYQNRSRKICLPLRISWFWGKNLNPSLWMTYVPYWLKDSSFNMSHHAQPVLHKMPLAPHGLKVSPSVAFLSLILLLGWDSWGLDKVFGCKDFLIFFKNLKVKFLMFLNKFLFNLLPKIL